jgi:hypothetical protein
MYEVTEDWCGNLYFGMKLDWDYNACTLDILMPGYIKKLLLKYKHCMPNQPQHCPYPPSPKHYSVKAQALLLVIISLKLSPEEIKEIQCIVGSISYYAGAVDITVLMTLSSMAIEQTKGTTNTMEKAKQLLDYLATNPDATIQYCASNIIINVHLDVSYLSEPDASNRMCRHFFHGLVCKRRRPHEIEWGLFNLICHTSIRHCICLGNRTWHPILKLQRGHDFLPDIGRIGISPAQNTGRL